jgi:hypothetical protein
MFLNVSRRVLPYYKFETQLFNERRSFIVRHGDSYSVTKVYNHHFLITNKNC